MPFLDVVKDEYDDVNQSEVDVAGHGDRSVGRLRDRRHRLAEISLDGLSWVVYHPALVQHSDGLTVDEQLHVLVPLPFRLEFHLFAGELAGEPEFRLWKPESYQSGTAIIQKGG
jgi:hypothetical protein